MRRTEQVEKILEMISDELSRTRDRKSNLQKLSSFMEMEIDIDDLQFNEFWDNIGVRINTLRKIEHKLEELLDKMEEYIGTGDE